LIWRKVQPDLVLVDLNLPDLSGQEVTTILRGDARFQATPIVALTGLGWESRDTSIAAGITGYLMKPLDLEELPRHVDYYLNGGQDQIDAETLAEAQVAYTRDMVERLEKRIRDLEAANKQLCHLDRMKDTFIQLTATVRTPLTLVYGYSRLLADHAPLRNSCSSMKMSGGW
jgi:CheY-like chemotaxis protein